MNRIPSLDGMRGIALLLMLAAHTSEAYDTPSWFHYVKNVIPSGIAAVHMFFVISGFLITLLLLREKEKYGTISLRRFYYRRFWRILPLFYLFLFSVLIYDHFSSMMDIPWKAYLSVGTFTSGLWTPIPWSLGHSWSLSVEEQFYLSWPLIFLLVPAMGKRVLAVFLVLAIPVSRVIAYIFFGKTVFLLIVTTGDAIVFGCILAYVMHFHKATVLRVVKFHPFLGRFIALAGIYAISILQMKLMLGVITVPFGITIFALGATYLIASYVLMPDTTDGKFLNSAPLVWLGKQSYGIYLWQQPFLAATPRFPHPFPEFPINLICIFVLGVVSHYCFEQPLLRLRDRFLEARASAKLEVAQPVAGREALLEKEAPHGDVEGQPGEDVATDEVRPPIAKVG